MKNLHWIFASLLALALASPLAAAHAGTATLKGTFKYKGPNGAEQLLNSGFIYLRDASKSPPMEKFTSKADHILGPTFGSPFSVSVPAGTYYLRLLQRKTVSGVAKPYGPPEEGDYTWVQRVPVTIAAGATLNLGTVYATPFSAQPVTITGRVKSQTGAPVAGRYVRAQTVPCATDGYNGDVNQCGPDKFLALQPTDANGNFTLYLQDPGTYYLYTSPCLTPEFEEYTGNRCGIFPGPGPLTLSRGEVKTLDITVWVY